MARVDGVTTAAVPVEHLALDGTGAPVVAVGTFAVLLVAAITRAADGFTYDWSDSTFKASPVNATTALVAVDATNLPGLYHVVGGFAVPADDTYTITVTQTGGPTVANVPAVSTLTVGPLVGLATMGTNLVDDLVPMADDLRDELHRDFGVRQFRTYLVRRVWSGTYVGNGSLKVTSIGELIPAPDVELADTHTLTEGGLQATGTATLHGVSLTYTQNQLLGEPLSNNEEFHYLVVDAHGQGISRRLFIPQDHPTTARSKSLAWDVTIRLVDTPPNVVAA
jgi:hypothetical protein